MDVRVLNFKPYDSGSMIGFFDLGYGGLVVKGCRLMQGNKGMWIALPKKQGEKDGETAWFDQLYFTGPERDHVRKLVLLELQRQGHAEGSAPPESRSQDTHGTLEGEDLSDYTGTQNDDVPF